MLDLDLLFKTQEKLDNHIVEKKGLQSRNLLLERIASFQVELGELANEWRGFKFWSNNQEPTTTDICSICNDDGFVHAMVYESHDTKTTVLCPACKGEKSDRNPLLEEYIDCLHFLLSIGNTIGHQDIVIDSDYTEDTALKTFIYLNGKATSLAVDIEVRNQEKHIRENYEIMFNMFIGLGEKYLGFTAPQIMKAYFDKNKVNYERQKVGY